MPVLMPILLTASSLPASYPFYLSVVITHDAVARVGSGQMLCSWSELIAMAELGNLICNSEMKGVTGLSS
jgi:hypothetical protein